jgi:Copper type II ascorbate-dependent monooxygenase, C-terminal domain
MRLIGVTGVIRSLALRGLLSALLLGTGVLAACGDSDGDDDDGSSSDGGDDGGDSDDDGGDDGDDGDDDGGDDSTPDGGGDVDAGAGYVPLITASWSLAPGDEGYVCATRTLTEDVYAGSLRPISPNGTHHTTIELSDPAGPDNPSFPCGPEFGKFFASGVATQDLDLPDGVALLAPAGQQLRVSLHLFNATDDTLTGTSGLAVRPVDPSEVDHTASVDYHGPMSFSIPANNEPHPETHQATLGQSTLVGIFPHMHQLGTHFRAVLQRAGQDPIVLWDEDYQFESQEFAPLAEIAVGAGDVLETTCTWTNDREGDVGWGPSSNDEMCYSILMSY